MSKRASWARTRTPKTKAGQERAALVARAEAAEQERDAAALSAERELAAARTALREYHEWVEAALRVPVGPEGGGVPLWAHNSAATAAALAATEAQS